MIKILATLLLTTNIALADTSYSWGITTIAGYYPSTLTIQKSQQCLAEVVFTNNTTKIETNLRDTAAKLQLADINVTAVVLQELEEQPDRFVVLTEMGYYAEPKELIVNENTKGIIQICAELLS